MKQFTTKGIVLGRTDFGEADRIITFLTPDHGKVKAMAKGVRKSKSKLAGGIELFSISDITLIVGRSEIDTLISSRLSEHFGNIVKDIDRTNIGYDCIKLINKATQDQPEEGYFYLLSETFESLDDFSQDLMIVNLWFQMQLIKLTGHTPNLTQDADGNKLVESEKYTFDFERMRFEKSKLSGFDSRQIKFLRLGFGNNAPRALCRIKDYEELAQAVQPAVQSMLQNYIRI